MVPRGYLLLKQAQADISVVLNSSSSRRKSLWQSFADLLPAPPRLRRQQIDYYCFPFAIDKHHSIHIYWWGGGGVVEEETMQTNATNIFLRSSLEQ